MKWCLDMPCLTDVYLTEKALKYIKFVTIIGGTHFIPLSWIDIGALQRHLRGGKHRYHLTIRVWNDGNPIWIMETRSSDCFPPYRSKYTLFRIANHPRRIPIPMITNAKSLFSNTSTLINHSNHHHSIPSYYQQNYAFPSPKQTQHTTYQ